ncbi:MAG: hypothetical protein VB140_00290 [Burkholderia sp.]
MRVNVNGSRSIYATTPHAGALPRVSGYAFFLATDVVLSINNL